MTAQRSTKQQHEYQRNTNEDQGKGCPFCAMSEGHPQFVRETEYLKVIKNRCPYSLWDDQGVVDHLMIVPKQHIGKLGSLNSEASHEFIRLIDEYEEKGYSFYARAPHSTMRSEPHQHTHLMKLDQKKRKFLLMIRRPWYFRPSK